MVTAVNVLLVSWTHDALKSVTYLLFSSNGDWISCTDELFVESVKKWSGVVYLYDLMNTIMDECPSKLPYVFQKQKKSEEKVI